MTQPAPALVPRTLEAHGLALRPFTAADEPAVARALRDPAILRWAAGRAVNDAPPVDRARAWLIPRLTAWSHGAAAFAVTDALDGALLGYLGLRDIHRTPDQAVAAYWVTPAARGRSVAARALGAAATWAFAPAAADGLAVHRITLCHALLNPGSCRVATAAGFTEEGTLRASFIDPAGARHDSHLHARLATDPEPVLG